MKIHASAYQRQAATAAAEARQRAGEAASSASASARVRTTSIGFSLGRFGLRYTQDEVSLGPDQESGASARLRERERGRAFASAMEVESEYQVLNRPQAGSSPSPGGASVAADPPSSLARRFGLAAYARAAQGREEDGSLGWELGAV